MTSILSSSDHFYAFNVHFLWSKTCNPYSYSNPMLKWPVLFFIWQLWPSLIKLHKWIYYIMNNCKFLLEVVCSSKRELFHDSILFFSFYNHLLCCCFFYSTIFYQNSLQIKLQEFWRMKLLCTWHELNSYCFNAEKYWDKT